MLFRSSITTSAQVLDAQGNEVKLPSGESVVVDATVNTLHVQGSAALNLGEGVLVAAVNDFRLDMFNGAVTTNIPESVVPRMGTLADVQVLSITVADADVFLGVGGVLTEDNGQFGVSTAAGAVGFLVDGASFSMLSYDNATVSAFGADRKSTRLNSSHMSESRMPSSA